MIKSLMKIFHLPTDTLRITSTPFSSRLNHQSIKEIRLRIARILNWAESELFHEHTPSRHDLPSRNDLSLRNDLPTAFLNRPSIQLNIYTIENCANTEL